MAGREEKAAAVWAHVNDLVPWEKNPTVIGETEIAEAISSFRRWGFGSALLGWGSKRRVVGGHVRRRAVVRMVGLDKSFCFEGAPGPGFVPIRWVEFASEEEAAAYALRDNNRIGKYDDAALQAVVRELASNEVRIDNLGFSEHDIERFRAQADAAASELDGVGSPSGDDTGDVGEKEKGKPVLHYDILFDNEGQEGRWITFLQALRKSYPDEESVGARLDAYLSDNPVSAA